MKFFSIPAAGALLVLAACSSPNPVLYTINAVPGPASAGNHRVIVVREVGIPRYLDRSQIVRANYGNKLTVASNDWWGEPLAGMMTRVLVEELSQRLPDDTVTSENSAVSATPDISVEFQLQRLDGAGPAAVALAGQIGIDPANGKPIARNVNITAPQATPDAQAYAAAASAAWGQVADAIVGMIGR